MQESRSWYNILIFPHSVITFNICCAQALPQRTIRMLDTFPPAMHTTTSTRSSQGLSISESFPSRTMLSRRLWSIFAPTPTMLPLIGLSKTGQARAEGTASAMRGTPVQTTIWASKWIGGTSRNNALPRLRSAPSWERDFIKQLGIEHQSLLEDLGDADNFPESLSPSKEIFDMLQDRHPKTLKLTSLLHLVARVFETRSTTKQL